MDHPQFIEGCLYLTADQAAGLRGAADTAVSQWQVGIPARVVEPGEQVLLPSGKTLLWSKLMGAFYVMDPSVVSPGWDDDDESRRRRPWRV